MYKHLSSRICFTRIVWVPSRRRMVRTLSRRRMKQTNDETVCKTVKNIIVGNNTGFGQTTRTTGFSLLRSCVFTECESVTKLICSTLQSCRCITSLMELRRDTYWFSVVDLALRSIPITVIGHTLEFQDTVDVRRSTLFPEGGSTVMSSGRIHQNLSFVFVLIDPLGLC